MTYFARDDWTAHPAYEPWWPELDEAYEVLRRRGTRVVAVSEVLHDRLAPTGPSAVVPNGIDHS
ncbi:MAG: hypothetical protein F2825_11590, partial [Actinobacteria bacterium]|nr:hypothetical protein [Actinomycetota bacterium]